MKRTDLIVGHSSGIGFATAKNALALGHAVIGLSRRASGLSSPDLMEIGADVSEADLAAVGIPATLDGVAYCPGSIHASVAMAKGAVEGLARSLAAEWAPSIRVNALAPSLTHPPLTARMLTTEARIQASRDRHPLKQIGQPEDLAGAALFLLSDQAKRITGQVWAIDGGMSAVRV